MNQTSATINPRFIPIITAEIAGGYENRSQLHLVPQDNLVLWRNNRERQCESEFKKHEKKWKEDTCHISSPVDKYLHPSYARIIGLGWPAVTHLLHSLKKQPADWFYALRAITNVNPVPDEAAGDMKRMSDIWIAWGEKQGVL